MKRLLICLIKIYQKTPINTHSKCKYIPTCSNYALTVINDFGVFKGLFLTIKSIRKSECSSFNLGLCRCSYRAGCFARTAINAGICINYILAVSLADSADGASCCACTTSDAIIRNLVCHVCHLL